MVHVPGSPAGRRGDWERELEGESPESMEGVEGEEPRDGRYGL